MPHQQRISEIVQQPGYSLAQFIGYSMACERCRRTFRCFRADETHCGCCRHMKEDGATAA